MWIWCALKRFVSWRWLVTTSRSAHRGVHTLVGLISKKDLYATFRDTDGVNPQNPWGTKGGSLWATAWMVGDSVAYKQPPPLPQKRECTGSWNVHSWYAIQPIRCICELENQELKIGFHLAPHNDLQSLINRRGTSYFGTTRLDNARFFVLYLIKSHFPNKLKYTKKIGGLWVHFGLEYFIFETTFAWSKNINNLC